MALIEQELKYRLTAQEYDRFLDGFRRLRREKKEQTNYYFDTPALDLRKKKIALRIRFYKGSPQAVLTFKRAIAPARTSMRGLKRREEIEVKIGRRIAKGLIRNFKVAALYPKVRALLASEFSTETLSQVQSLGKIKNRRIFIPILPKLILELDHFTVFGKEFYELEVETTEPVVVDRWVRNAFQKAHVKYRPEDTSKLKRFLTVWMKKNSV